MSDGDRSGDRRASARRSSAALPGVIGAVALIVAVTIAVWVAVGSGGGSGRSDALGGPPSPTATPTHSTPTDGTPTDGTPTDGTPTPSPSGADRGPAAQTPSSSDHADDGRASSPPATSTGAPTATRPTVSAAARAQCSAQFTACVDLAARISWLQHDGRITYGPVRIMPGAPVNPTPTGHFVVQWKDQDHISGEYHTPMPYSVFFAAGGVAFHQGSLTQGSHGCVHLSMKDAAYYYAHLPVGVQVAVF